MRRSGVVLSKAAVWRWLRKRRDVTFAVAVFSLTLIGIIWGTVIAERRAEKSEAIAGAIKQNSNLAVAYEEHVVRTLKSLDAVTLFIRYEYQEHGRAMDMARYIAGGVVDPKLFSILSVVDENGDIVLSSRKVPPTNYRDRDYFRAQLQRHADELYIGKPVLGRISHTWQIPLSRRILKSDGSFGGIVVVSVDPGYFTRFYQKADLGKEGLVILVGLDGIVRARRAGQELSFGEDISVSNLLAQRASSPTGNFLDRDSPGSPARYVSYRTLPEYPLVVAVGAAESDVLAGFMQNIARAERVALLVTFVIAVFAALLILAVLRQKRVAAALAEDISVRKRLETELRAMATTDMLTGLPNRRHFLARLHEEHARLGRQDVQHAAVLMLDLDHFKRINDTFGHATGDAVLAHVASLICGEIRSIDTASRLGGEEFAVILTGATDSAALEFAERLRKKIASSPTAHEGHAVTVTVSIGIAAMTARDTAAEAALARADTALYRAKQAGRDRSELITDRSAVTTK
jgi:diguanylate cyclase (GGDEF)-like protein